MRIEPAADSKGDLQFVVHAESTAERIVLKAFMKQVQEQAFFLHGCTYENVGYASGAVGLGPTSFNFGSYKPKPKGKA